MPPYPPGLEIGGLVRAGGPMGPEASGVFPSWVGGGFHHVASPFFFFFPLHFFSSRFYLEAAPGVGRAEGTPPVCPRVREGEGERSDLHPVTPSLRPPPSVRSGLLTLPLLFLLSTPPSLLGSAWAGAARSPQNPETVSFGGCEPPFSRGNPETRFPAEPSFQPRSPVFLASRSRARRVPGSWIAGGGGVS